MRLFCTRGLLTSETFSGLLWSSGQQAQQTPPASIMLDVQGLNLSVNTVHRYEWHAASVCF
jgi:hypothetical protein